MIHDLIDVLTPIEKETLQQRLQRDDNQLNRFIDAHLKTPGLTKEAALKQFKINSNTYFKNLSLAKDELYDVIKLHMRNAYDDLLLSNVLYRRGLEVHANKLRLKLETEYSKQGWWNVLQELYNMEMLVAYTKCDVKKLHQIKAKLFNNIDRLQRFVKVDREVVVQMAIIEKGDLKEKDYGNYAKTLNGLLKQAEEIGQYLPVFNILHCFFVLYTQYEVDLDKAKAVVKKINQLPGIYGKDAVLPYTRNVILLNTAGFHIDFATGEQPEKYLSALKGSIGKYGMLFDTQAWMNFGEYYFFTGKLHELDKSLREFKNFPLDRSLQYQVTYLNCLQAFAHNSAAAFNGHLNKFYSHERTRAHNNYDLKLRYLEMLLLLKEGQLSLLGDKLEATIKFTRRNFTKYRMAIEKQHWDLMKAALKGKPIKKADKKIYRLTDFIVSEINRSK